MPYDFETLKSRVDMRGVAYIALDRADKRNALSAKMIDELTTLASRLNDDPDIRVVVLSGEGPVFCAGGDLAWMKAQIEAGRAERMAAARHLAMMLHALNTMSKPLIVQAHGGAFGGGVGLACVSDVTVASDDTKFGLTETRRGLIPATIGPYIVARLGEGRARRIFMSSRIFDAAEAQNMDIVARIAPRNALEAVVEAEVAPYLRVAPGAVAAAKAHVRSLGMPITQAEIDQSVERLAATWENPEAMAGVMAFFAKASPPWEA
jgi:methylglutaconyl-CoA hydratase